MSKHHAFNFKTLLLCAPALLAMVSGCNLPDCDDGECLYFHTEVRTADGDVSSSSCELLAVDMSSESNGTAMVGSQVELQTIANDFDVEFSILDGTGEILGEGSYDEDFLRDDESEEFLVTDAEGITMTVQVWGAEECEVDESVEDGDEGNDEVGE